MPRRKSAPHYKPGVYLMERAHSGGQVIEVTITDVRLVEFSGGKYADWLYTITIPPVLEKKAFGAGTKFAYQCEVDRLMVSAVAQKKAA